MSAITFDMMATAAELEVAARHENLRICRARSAKGQWPVTDVDRKAGQLPVFEEIARVLRKQADQVAEEEQKRSAA